MQMNELHAQLKSDFELHRKSRKQKHALYPARFDVSDAMVSWTVPFEGYAPVEFNAPVVLDARTPWADPQEVSKVSHPFTSFMGEVKFNDAGRPLNPVGRTGLCGRGVLGKWGANFAVDSILTTVDSDGLLVVLTIIRKDTGERAFPGGMVDPGEGVFATRNRELFEELAVRESDLAQSLYERVVWRGYVDDPRNTDNAWLETTAIHTHLSNEVAARMNLKAGDDAADFSWVPISVETLSNFYASHGLTLFDALLKLAQSDAKLLG